MRKSIVTVLAALATSAALATPALAEETEVVVSYSDLDLTDAAGAAKLEQRVDAAAEQVCSKPDLRNIKGMVAFEACKTEAKTNALEQVSVLEPYQSMALASVF
ncbi:UrcA family protein [Croceibacterium sp. LX-88]|jgi:UrcA family protein|uniref:UrcA family protein n=1 Tax=Croceibacterium selenioxidans TaxID=2838833 RepID=A0ABS5W6X8_9SPHN|nr:UrcA family protein [Croceibacterium selenioxidans]MBT2135518.1 UrcA family protein [Croceibacterium selenioxidans]